MNTIILLVERNNGWSPEIWATELGGASVAKDRITIEREEAWLSVIRDDRVLDDFEPIERSRLDKLTTEPAAYVIGWRGSHLVEQLLRSIPADVRAAIDNDHGLLVPVQMVARKPIGSWIRAKFLVV